MSKRVTKSHRRPRLGVSFLCLMLVLGVAGCQAADPQEPVDITTVTPTAAMTTATAPASEATGAAVTAVSVTQLASGLKAPWSIAFYKTSILLSERDDARILELTTDGSLRKVGSVPGVVPEGEGGLLGLAVQEDYLYAYATGASENFIQRFPLQGQPGEISLGPAELIFVGIPAATIHNGGRLAFGPDGMLYVTAGDAGEREQAQDQDSLGGKILRLTPSGTVPEDNPFPGSTVYSYGHRNPQGLAWDEQGTMYASEFGQDTWDELNVIEAGTNYGWPIVEGIAGAEGMRDPIQQWEPAQASPSGLAYAQGALWLATLRGQQLWRVPLSDTTKPTALFSKEYGRLRDVVAAPDGTLLLLTNNTDGRGSPGPKDDQLLRMTIPEP